MHTAPLRSWALLTRTGVPPMAVIRRPLNLGIGEPLPVGAAYPSPDPKNFGQLRRTRQYYQQRRIAPGIALVMPATAPTNPVAASPDLSILPPHESKPLIRPTLPVKKGGNTNGTR